MDVEVIGCFFNVCAPDYHGVRFFGWLWLATRKTHIIYLGPKDASWFYQVFGLEWDIAVNQLSIAGKKKLGENNLPASFIILCR